MLSSPSAVLLVYSSLGPCALDCAPSYMYRCRVEKVLRSVETVHNKPEVSLLVCTEIRMPGAFTDLARNRYGCGGPGHDLRVSMIFLLCQFSC